MRLLGFLLLPAGLGIALAALVLFDQIVLRNLFVVAGVSVQVLGLALVFHRMRRGKGLSR
jgi:hypothetical protein